MEEINMTNLLPDYTEPSEKDWDKELAKEEKEANADYGAQEV